MSKYRKIFLLIFAIVTLSGATQVNAEKKIVVDKNGNGNFTSLQEAINSVRAFDPVGPTTIFVKNGTYYEKIVISEHTCNVKIQGEDKDRTIITYNDHANINKMGTFRTSFCRYRWRRPLGWSGSGGAVRLFAEHVVDFDWRLFGRRGS